MKKGLAFAIALAVCAAAGGSVYYRFVYSRAGENGGRISSNSEDAVSVESVSSLAGLDSASGIAERYAGVVEPQETWSVRLDSDKTVKETYVEEGDIVKAGDKLFAYDTSDDESKLRQGQIDVERLENEISQTQVDLDQANKDRASATDTDTQLEVQSRILQDENTIKQDEYEIKSKKLEMQQYQNSIAAAVVTSQLDGVVRSINDNSSNSLNSDSSSDAYMTIMAVGDYRVKGTINEQNYNSIYEGMRMIVYSRVDNSTWTGTVSRIMTDSGSSSGSNDDYSSSGSSDTTSTNYPFYVELDDSSSLMLGQHVYMEEDLGQMEKKSGIWLPEYYFNDVDNGSAWVWAASSANTLEKRAVTLGDYDESTMEYQVTSGLDENDYIRTDDEEITEGLPVTYLDYSSDDASYADDASWDDMSGDASWNEMSDDAMWDDTSDDASWDDTADEASWDDASDDTWDDSDDDM